VIGEVEQHTVEPAHIHDDENEFHWFSPGMQTAYGGSIVLVIGFLLWCAKRRIRGGQFSDN